MHRMHTRAHRLTIHACAIEYLHSTRKIHGRHQDSPPPGLCHSMTTGHGKGATLALKTYDARLSSFANKYCGYE